MACADDHGFMTEALRLAEQGLYTTTPNPRVGCLIVKDGKIVGRGFHARAGEPHAEAVALREAAERACGATVYVTLEPCSHYGRTPPCADALVAAGVRRVVVAMEDPNPRVRGRGMERLRQAGIAVECGVLEEEARALNIGFVSRMTRGRPWVRMKIAASLDGRTALPDGRSQWITGEAARRDAHHWRARSCAVLTGIGTVREDDPRLTVRYVETPRQPLRVVVDSRLETPESARVLAGAPVLIAYARDDQDAAKRLQDRGAEVLCVPNPSGKVDLPTLFRLLGERGINEVLVEAGTRLNGSLLKEALVDELLVYLAPCLLGDAARGMASLAVPDDLSARLALRLRDVRLVGGDLRILAEVVQEKIGPTPGRE